MGIWKCYVGFSSGRSLNDVFAESEKSADGNSNSSKNFDSVSNSSQDPVQKVIGFPSGQIFEKMSRISSFANQMEVITGTRVSGWIPEEEAIGTYLLDQDDLSKLTPIRKVHSSLDADEEPWLLYRKRDIIRTSLIKWGSLENIEKERTRRINFRQLKLQASQSRMDILERKRTRRLESASSSTNPLKQRTIRLKQEKGGSGAATVVATSLAATTAIVIAKISAAVYTGSMAMFSESIRSSFDVVNQIFYASGIYLSGKKPTVEHPYGFGTSGYLNSLVSSAVLLFGGGAYCIYEGIHAYQHPGVIESPSFAAAVLVFALLAEGRTLQIAVQEMKERAKHLGLTYWEYLKNGPDPFTASILAEDAIAVGSGFCALSFLFCAFSTGDAHWDAAGSIACGSLAALVALFNLRRNYLYLHSRAVPVPYRDRAKQLILSNPIVSSLHEVKATVLMPNVFLFRAEIMVDATRVNELVLKQHCNLEEKVEKLFGQSRSVENNRLVLRDFLEEYGEYFVLVQGDQIDQIEQMIREEMPEFKFIDLEIV